MAKKQVAPVNMDAINAKLNVVHYNSQSKMDAINAGLNVVHYNNSKPKNNNLSEIELKILENANKSKKEIKTNYDNATVNLKKSQQNIGNALTNKGIKYTTLVNEAIPLSPFETTKTEVGKIPLIKNQKTENQKRQELLNERKAYTNYMSSNEGKELSKLRTQAQNDVAINEYLYNNKLIEERDINLYDKSLGRYLNNSFGMIFNRRTSTPYKLKNGAYDSLPTYSDLLEQKTSQSYNTKVGKFLGDATANIARITTSQALNAILPGAGTTMYFGDMFTKQYNDNLMQGYTQQQSMLNSAIGVASEVVMEKLLGGTAKQIFGGNSSELSKTIGKLTTKLCKNAKVSNFFAHATSEAMEEFLQTYVEKLNENLTLGKKNKVLSTETFGEAIYNSLVGAASGGLLGINTDVNADNSINFQQNAIENQNIIENQNVSDNQVLQTNVNNINQDRFIYEKSDNIKIDNLRKSASEYFNNSQAQTNNLNGTKYSIKVDNNGNKYVNIDTDQDIFEGIKPKDFNKIAKMYINDYLIGETALNTSDKVIIDKMSSNKYTNPGQAQYFFEEKMKLTPELKNVLEIATKKSEFQAHKNNAKYNNWEYYEFDFKLGNKTFSGLINIGVDDNGNKHFYEVNNIKRTTISGTSPNNRSGSFVGNNISQNSVDVNKNDTSSTKYSMQLDKNDTQKADKWQEHLDKNYIPTGTRTDMSKIKLPTKKNIEHSKIVSQFEKSKNSVNRSVLLETAKDLKITHKNGALVEQDKKMLSLAGKNKKPKIIKINDLFDSENLNQQKIKAKINSLNKYVNDTEAGYTLVVNKDTNIEYELGRKGIDKTFSKNVPLNKLNTSTILKEIGEERIYYTTSYDENDKSGIKYHHFLTPVKEINGKGTAFIRSVIKEYTKDNSMNNKFYYHQFEYLDNKKETIDLNHIGIQAFDNSFVNKSISQNNKDVKLPLVNNSNMQENTKNTSKTAELLEKRPERAKKTAKEYYRDIKREMVDKGEAIERLSKKTGNNELYAKYDHMGTAEAEGMYSIAVAQTDNYGKKIWKSVVEIWQPAYDKGLEQEFSIYLLHKHNIDRYRQGKPVFGDDITSEMSKQFVKDSEKAYPEFKEWAKDINRYNKNQMQNMVDAGLTSAETQEYLNSIYDNYVRIYRDIKGTSPITNFKGNLKVNAPIKKAKGGNQDILPLRDSMAQQTIEIKKAIRKNEFGLELLNVLDNGEYTEYNGKDTLLKNDDGTYSFTVFKDGKPVKMEIDKGIYEALEVRKNINPAILAPLRGVAQVQRALLTDKHPIFILTNFFRDIGDAPFNSKYASKFFINYVRAAYDMKTNGKWTNLYKALGGEQNTYFNYETGIKLPKTGIVSKVLNGISALNRAVEQIPRLAEFISTKEAGGSNAEAMYNAAEITTNFKKGGDIAKAINRNGANFFNASIQGFDKQIRNFKGQKGVKGYVNLLSKVAILGIMPSVLNHLLLEDDEDYKALQDYNKDAYYLFKIGKGKFIRIPKGRMMSIFGMVARRTLEYQDGEKDAFKGMGQQAINQVAPNNPLSENVVAPITQAISNKSWNGSDIVPTRLQDEPIEQQYDEKTDVISRFIGKTFKVSPKKVNYVIDQYSGGIGDVALPLLTPQAHEDPITAKFTTDSIMNSKYTSEFYDLKDEYAKKSNSLDATEEDKLVSKYFGSVGYEMNELYKEKREIQNSDLSNKDKLKKVKEIQKQINDIAKYASEDYTDSYINNNYAYIGDKEYYINTKNEWEKLTDKEIEDIKDLHMLEEEKQIYFDVRTKASKIKNDKDITSERKKEEIASVFIKSNLTDKQIAHLYSKYYSDIDKLNNFVDLNIPIKEFIKLNSQSFDGKYNARTGKTISGSKKEQFIDYVKTLNLSVVQKAILIKAEYSSFDDYDNEIISYVKKIKVPNIDKMIMLKRINIDSYDEDIVSYYTNRKDMSVAEKAKELTDLGFIVRNGEVYY